MKNQYRTPEKSFRTRILSFVLMFSVFGALFPVIVFIVDIVIGDPSSTSSLILLMVVPFGIIGGIIGLLFESLVKALYKGSKIRGRIFIGTGLFLLLLVVAVPVILTLNHQNINRSRIILCADAVKTVPKAEIDAEANRLLFSKVVNPDNITGYEIAVKEDVLHIKDVNAGIEKSFDYSKYEYIRSLNYSKFGSEKYLAVLLNLRATSHKYLFVLFDNKLNIIYQEMRTR